MQKLSSPKTPVKSTPQAHHSITVDDGCSSERLTCPECEQSPCQCPPHTLLDIALQRRKRVLDSAGWPMDL